jgi:hypothetical protein
VRIGARFGGEQVGQSTTKIAIGPMQPLLARPDDNQPSLDVSCFTAVNAIRGYL